MKLSAMEEQNKHLMQALERTNNTCIQMLDMLIKEKKFESAKSGESKLL